MPTQSKKRYLGDGLYAEFDGFMLVLRANVPTTDHVYLDPDVWSALVKFMDESFQELSNERASQ